MMNNKKIRLPDNCGFKWEGGLLLDEKGNEVCNFYPEVITRYKISLNGNCTYKILFHIGKEEHAVEKILSLEELQKYDYLNVSNYCMFGINISVSQIRRILLYLIQKQILSLAASDKVLLGQLGWNILEDGKKVYCAGTEVIADGNVADIEVDASVKSRFQFPIVSREVDVLKVCKKYLKLECPTITTLILTSVVASLRSLFVEAEVIPHFVVYIYGTTGTFKTTIAKYFAWLYGDNTKLGGLFGELESTNFALEQMIDLAKDVCVVIDDIAPCQKNHNTKEKMEKAASLIRKATSGVGTKKGVDGKLKEISFDVMMILTAETLLETTSVMNRTILLNADKYKISAKALHLMEKYPDFSVQLQRSIIEWAVGNPEEIVGAIHSMFRDFRNEEPKSSKGMSANRLRETRHVLQVAWQLLVKWSDSFDAGYGSLLGVAEDVADTMNRLMEDEYAIIRRMELQQQPENILLLLLKVIDNKSIQIAESRVEFKLLEIEGKQEACFGLFHKGYLHLRDQKFLDFLQYKYKKNITKSSFRKCLEKEGLLIKDKSKNRRKKLDGESYLVIDYEGLIELFRE